MENIDIRNGKDSNIADELAKAQDVEGLRDMVDNLLKDRSTLLRTIALNYKYPDEVRNSNDITAIKEVALSAISLAKFVISPHTTEGE